MSGSPLVISTPTRVRLPLDDSNKGLVEGFLTYVDKSVDFQIRKMQKSRWFDADRHADRLADLQAERKKCLLEEDEGGYYTLSGLAHDIAKIIHSEVKDEVRPPPYSGVPWLEIPFPMRDYQVEAFNKLWVARHGAVEMGTGLGKSRIILELAKSIGLKTVIMAPTTSIAEQLYGDFLKHLGKKYVGKYFGGKKEADKRFVVGIHASFVRVTPGTADWFALQQTQVFIADESHLTPAATLKEVCLGLFQTAPYRFFLSGTQMRADGSDIVLKGITGPIVYKMTVEDGVNKGWLAAPRFRMINVISNDSYQSDDALRMTQRHLLYNPLVIQKAAQVANTAVTRLGHPVLILIDEVAQFAPLLAALRHQVGFAHGPLTAENSGDVPPEYQKVDNTQLVADFNAGKFPILIGTSAVGMGTDIRACKTLIYLMGGKSEVQVKQAIGRATRKIEGVKDECFIIDFDVTNVDMMHRHARERLKTYADIYPDVEIL